ncbi:MAG: hypothetical protein EOM24_24480, partial [Chloroflexia bacterium]|nr:hypothetical protein [Chloroflexia bacterium]
MIWPLGSANMEIDPLSAIFVVVISVVTMLAAVYGSAYLQAHGGQRNLGVSWFFFNVLAASMMVVVAARNGVLFLVGWELMSLASFFLVVQDDEKEGVRRAGWVYLVAMHLGTAFLLALFLLLGKGAGSLDFERFSTAAAPTGVFFVLALLGFGTKAGFIPMHVWLPEAHPAAPSHVSAVMSGVMIKTGIYGLLRTLTWLGPPPAWWGWTLLAVGLVSGVLGVLYALAQHDLKRLLAYHSVENIGSHVEKPEQVRACGIPGDLDVHRVAGKHQTPRIVADGDVQSRAAHGRADIAGQIIEVQVVRGDVPRDGHRSAHRHVIAVRGIDIQGHILGKHAGCRDGILTGNLV